MLLKITCVTIYLIYFDISSKLRILLVLLCILQENFCLWVRDNFRYTVPSLPKSLLLDYCFLSIPLNFPEIHIITLAVGR